MNSEEVMDALASVQAVLTGHFIYASGKHGPAYVNKDALYPHVLLTRQICNAMGEMFLCQGIETVVGPALGGIILSQRVAEYLEMHNTTHDVDQVYSVFAEKLDLGFVIRRGQERHVFGRRVLVVEDILTTGKSAKQTVEAVRKHNGEVVAVAAITNRGGVTAEQLGVPELKSLLALDLQAWTEGECQLCAEGVPVNTEVGHGAEFLERQRQS